jgi:hypothetical protein
MSVLMIESALRVSVIALVALIAVALLRTRSAALRHWILAVAVVCACAAPLFSAVLLPSFGVPGWSLRIGQDPPGPPGEDDRALSADTAGPQGTVVQTEFSLPPVPRGSFVNLSLEDAARSVWLLGSLGSLFILLVGLVRLSWLASHARSSDAGPWFAFGEELQPFLRTLFADPPSPVQSLWIWHVRCAARRVLRR